MSFLKKSLQNFTNTRLSIYLRKNFYLRRSILLFCDLLIVFISLQYLSYTSQLQINSSERNFFLFNVLFCTIFYILSGQYSSLTKYLGKNSIYKLVLRNFLLINLLSIVYILLNLASISFVSLISFWIILSGIMVLSKSFMKEILIQSNVIIRSNKLSNVVIYGAGSAGVQLLSALSNTANIQFFLDDNKKIIGREIDGIKIISPDNFKKFAFDIDKILLAIPSLKKKRKKNIYNYLKKFDLPILEVPTLEELTTGAYQINSLRAIDLDNLLGREIIYADNTLLKKSSNLRTIFISGAGGSIGMELCIQIIRFAPKRLILLDNNEFALYKTIERIKPLVNKKSIDIVPLLGSACDSIFINKVFKKFKVNSVFHCAAYKQVPLVEVNTIEGIKNNFLSTYVVCENALKNDVEEVMFISTDKAVRPTSIMGASKRLAELIVQSFSIEAKKSAQNTLFSMVRFGNVLGSSGSVVPLFKKQIEQGGPITLTHPDIIRYFMSIEEAAQLVLQASVLAEGGDVFLLDMGKPVKIIDLAKEMIRLSGLQLKDENNPNGDIEISISGLRSGEKLYEELLINAKSENTAHKLIYRAKERHIEPSELWVKLDEIKSYINEKNTKGTLKILKEIVGEWNYDKSKIYNF